MFLRVPRPCQDVNRLIFIDHAQEQDLVPNPLGAERACGGTWSQMCREGQIRGSLKLMNLMKLIKVMNFSGAGESRVLKFAWTDLDPRR